MANIDKPIDEEFDDPIEDDEAEEVEVPEVDPTAPATEGAEVESLETLIAKKDGHPDDDEDPLMALGREERLEPLAVKVVPPQPSEFVCKRCFLVKHQSQLKDKKRTLCRDCA
jgi:hypothetical protein